MNKEREKYLEEMIKNDQEIGMYDINEKKLTKVEKEVVRQFVFGFSRQIQKLQVVETYGDIKRVMEQLDKKIDFSNWFKNFEDLTIKINKNE